MLACSRLHLKLNNHEEYKQKISQTKKTKKNIQKSKSKKTVFFISLVTMSSPLQIPRKFRCYRKQHFIFAEPCYLFCHSSWKAPSRSFHLQPIGDAG